MKCTSLCRSRSGLRRFHEPEIRKPRASAASRGTRLATVVGAMSGIPSIGPLAAARAAVSRPYDFITERCRELGSDVFLIRLPGAPIFCMTGAEAAEIFYDPTLFERRNAAPGPLVATLVGQGGVQGLDDEEHARRK